jgi:hypothetical protein
MAELSPLESPDTSGIETSRANLIAQQQRLMSLLEERAKPNPLDFWSTLAGAAANSGNWGSQTLAALGAGAGLADRQQEAKEITSAQMRMEIANSQDQMAREQGMYKALQSIMGGSGVSAGAANTLGLNVDEQSVLSNMSSADRRILLSRASTGRMEDIKEVHKILSGMVAENAKVPDAVKTMNNYIAMLPPEARAAARSQAAQMGLIPGQEQKDYSTPFGTFKMTPYDYSKFQLAQSKGAGREWLESYRSGNAAPSASVPATVGPAGMPSEEQKKIIQTGSEERAKKDAEFSALTRSNIFSAADVAPRLSSLAQSNMQLIQDNPDAVGVLSGGGVGNAVLGLLSKIRIGGQAAGADFDTSGIEKAIRDIGPTKLPNENKDVYEARRQRNIDASLQIVRNLAEMELNFAKSFMKGQGAVSNMERNITRALGGNISDSRTALMAKNDLLIITADADEKIRDAYVDWANKNPNKGAEYFKGSEEEKSIRNEYNAKVTALNARYFAPKQAAPASAQKDNSELRDRLRKQLGG